MPKMTPEQEAAYALDFGVARSDLSEQAQLAYDRLVEQRAHPITQESLAQGAATAASAGSLAGGTGALRAAPGSVPPGQVRPRRRWYWLALAAAVAGFGWAAVVLLVVIAGEVDSFQRVPIPGAGEVSLQTGHYLIYYEAPRPFSGPVPPGHVNVTPLSGPGAVGDLTGYPGSLTYSVGSLQGTAIAIVQISRPGRFLVRATSSPAVHGARLAIGPSLAGWIWIGTLPATGLILAGIAFASVVAVKRRKSRRAILAQPLWSAPPPAA
jgi:hypothetical protein